MLQSLSTVSAEGIRLSVTRLLLHGCARQHSAIEGSSFHEATVVLVTRGCKFVCSSLSYLLKVASKLW